MRVLSQEPLTRTFATGENWTWLTGLSWPGQGTLRIRGQKSGPNFRPIFFVIKIKKRDSKIERNSEG